MYGESIAYLTSAESTGKTEIFSNLIFSNYSKQIPATAGMRHKM